MGETVESVNHSTADIRAIELAITFASGSSGFYGSDLRDMDKLRRWLLNRGYTSVEHISTQEGETAIIRYAGSHFRYDGDPLCSMAEALVRCAANIPEVHKFLFNG